MTALDHLVVAGETLDTSGLDAVLGVALSGGGKHARMGTHNRLLRLGTDAYLELIA
ncbi:MAG: VOC family protein, partial [Myxococcaceae bacterium]